MRRPVQPTTQRIYCYAPQQRAVHHLLEPFVERGRVMLCCCDERGISLRGIEDPVFVMVTHHYARVPQPLHEMLAAMGATLWHIDDSHNRRKHDR